MARLFSTQTNFSSGELDPAMRMRIDTGAYQNGAGTLLNTRLLNTGGVERRPGSYHRAALAGLSRLHPFEFDADENYVFAFRNTAVDIYSAAGVLLTTLTGGRWTTATLYSMTFAQLGDTMLVFDRLFQPHVIRRTGLSSFTLSNFAFAKGIDGKNIFQPYFKLAADTTTMKASSDAGTVTLTSSAGFFTATHIGTRIKLFETEVQITAVTSTTVATGVVKGRIKANFDPNPYRTIKGSTLVTVTLPFHGFIDGQVIVVTGSNDTGGIVAGSLDGSRTVDVIDKHTFQFVAGGAATSSVDGGGPSVAFTIDNVPVRNWSEQVFSAVNGWPACGVFHQQRLYLGGSPEIPAGLWGSQVGDFFAFDLGTATDTDGIFILVGQENGVTVRHLISGKHLQIFTEAGEYYVPRQDGQPITPLTITTDKQTPYGIGRVAPVSLDGATIFLQKSKTAVREFIYSEAERSYNANPLSLVATHMLNQPMDMAVLYGTDTRPEQYCLMVNADGSIAVFHSARVERLAGWAKWLPGGGGLFRSATVVNNRIWVCIERAGAYFLEEFGTDEVTLDGAKVFTNATAQAVWTLGAPYTSRSVWVVTRNPATAATEWSLGEYAVSAGGVLTLPSAHKTIVVGYNYDFAIETLTPNITTDKGPMLGELKRLAQVQVSVLSALAVSVEGQALILRQVTDDLSVPPERVSGYQTFSLLGYSREPTVTITQSDPLPLTVLGVVMKVSL